MNLVTLVAVIAFFSSVSSQGDDFNPCLQTSAQESCAACIATHAKCAWCKAEDFNENKKRCDKYEEHMKSSSCVMHYLEYPDHHIKNVDDDNVQDGDRPEEAVQIQPQRVKITVRPNKPMYFTLTFRQAANYPVDLYYLMDLSNSMEDDKTQLAQLGDIIAKRMSAITKNFRLGFGSFVDKVVSPYVSTVPSKQRQPCKLINGPPCVPPYGYKNQLKLDLETDKFARRVKLAEVSGNLDAPEGGFDAIMQAVVCENDIGWRPISRRMLVFSTDAGFHTAGDGKLGGIVSPNDGQCHMQSDEYSWSSKQDYPSVSQISNTVKDKAVSIIFAVTQDQYALYNRLSQYIDSSTTGVLANDSSNIVDLIQDNYEKISSVVKMRTENLGDNMTVEFFSRCLGEEKKKTNECKNLKIGQKVEFNVKVHVAECPKDRRDWRRKFTIKPAGYKESLTVEMDLICECECERPENEVKNSPKCSNGNGTYECGKCSCNEGYYGDTCQCKLDSTTSKESLEECIEQNSTLPCSGRGACECGRCKCNPRAQDSSRIYSGKYCQCDDFSCPRHKKQLCGGSERGKCECGTCTCNKGFTGKACDCAENDDGCKNAAGVICSGFGSCDCGECICESKYSGPQCQQCLTCPHECDKYIPCIQCKVLKTGKYSAEECDLKCPKIIDKVSHIEDSFNVTQCQIKDDDECVRYFSYEFNNKGNVVLKYQEEKYKICPESVDLLAIVGGVVGGILAVGLLLLLLWKFLVHIHDTREYAKFEKERQNAKWDTGENPIYKQATSHFKNPTYGGR